MQVCLWMCSSCFIIIYDILLECEFLSGNRAEATKMFEGLLAKAESVVDRAKCYSLLVQVLVSCSDCIYQKKKKTRTKNKRYLLINNRWRGCTRFMRMLSIPGLGLCF